MHVRRNGSAAFVLLIICLLPCAGCLGGTGAQDAGSPARTNQSWTGSWVTKIKGGDSDTPMDLVQQGVVVTGSYGYGDGTVAGIVKGDRLSGTWSEKNGEISGPFEFMLADNGLSFSGWWAYSGEKFDDIRAGPPVWWGHRA